MAGQAQNNVHPLPGPPPLQLQLLCRHSCLQAQTPRPWPKPGKGTSRAGAGAVSTPFGPVRFQRTPAAAARQSENNNNGTLGAAELTEGLLCAQQALSSATSCRGWD